jgi:AcrR family transcriptional regulator
MHAPCQQHTLQLGRSTARFNCVTEAAIDLSRVQPAHERIVEAARELFCRHGIHATGIDRILAAAGASKMALYGRFGSKNALLREVLAREGANWRVGFFSAVEGAGPDAIARLHGIAGAMEQWYLGGRFYGCAFMNAIAEHDKSDQWLRDVAAAHHGKVLAFLSDLAAQAGFEEPNLLARQILLLIDGATAALMVTNDAAVVSIMARNLDAVLKTAARTIMPPATPLP